MKTIMRLLFLASVACANLGDMDKVSKSIDRYHALFQKGAISEDHYNQVRDKLYQQAMGEEAIAAATPQLKRRTLSDDIEKKAKCLGTMVDNDADMQGDCLKAIAQTKNGAVETVVQYLKQKGSGEHDPSKGNPWCPPNSTDSDPAGPWLWNPVIAGQTQWGRCQWAADTTDDKLKQLQSRVCHLSKDNDGRRIGVWGQVDTSRCPYAPCASLTEDIGSAIEIGECAKNTLAGGTCAIMCNEGEHKGKKSTYTCPKYNLDEQQMPEGRPPMCLTPCKGGIPFKLDDNMKPEEKCKSVPYGETCKVGCKDGLNGETILRCHRENTSFKTKLEGKTFKCGEDFNFKMSGVPEKALGTKEAELMEKYLAANGHGKAKWKGCYGWVKGQCSGSSCYSQYHTACDKKGSLIKIVWLKNGTILGGFSDIGSRHNGSNGSYRNEGGRAKNFIFRIKSVNSSSGGVGYWANCSGNCDYYNQAYGLTLGGGHDFTMYGSSWGTMYANPSNYKFRRINSYYLNEHKSTVHFGPGQAHAAVRFVAYIKDK